MTCTHYNFPVPEEKMVRVITGTDLCNEADDPFAVVQALLSPKFDNVGVVAAHFGTRDPNGMQKSWQGLKDLTVLMQLTVPVLHGAPHALPDAATPVPSEGAKLIIREAMKEDTRPLFVLLLGPLTDLASAYLQEPRIAGRLTAIWIGGAPYPVGGPEFNLGNDVNAANVVFSSKIELWQVPKNVYEMMPVSLAELQVRVRPYGEIGKYLFDQLVAHSQEDIPRKSDFRTGETWVLGDSPAVGLILYEHRFEFDWVPAPYITQEQAYVHTGTNRPIRVYKSIDSRLILEDMYAKLQLFAAANS